MTEQPGHPCYFQNRDKFLAEHRKMAVEGREIVSAWYGEAFANTLLGESQAEFEGLIPVLPYVGECAGALSSYATIQQDC